MRMAESLSDVLPDLVVMLRRDGVILSHLGGRSVSALVPRADAAGQRLESVWPSRGRAPA